MGIRFAIDASPAPWASAAARGPEAVRAAVDRTVDLARIGDEAGIESIWVVEDPDGWDAFAVLGAMARATGRIRLTTGVTNPYYRHPAMMAASVATLDHLSNGRAMLGLGRGQGEWYEQALGMHVGRPSRAVRETIDLLRQWWSPELRASSPESATEFQVRAWERVIRPLQGHVPIHLAAVGPIALRLAGRHADGVLFNDLASITYLRQAIALVRESAVAAGRDPEAIEFSVRATLTVTDDPEALYEQRKATVAMIHALPGMERLLESPNFDTARVIADVRSAMRTKEILGRGGGFGDLRRGGDLEAAKRAIPTELMRDLVVAGPLPETHARLDALDALGVSRVFLATPKPDTTADELEHLLTRLSH